MLSCIPVNNISSPSIPEIGHRAIKPWSTWSRIQKLLTGIDAQNMSMSTGMSAIFLACQRGKFWIALGTFSGSLCACPASNSSVLASNLSTSNCRMKPLVMPKASPPSPACPLQRASLLPSCILVQVHSPAASTKPRFGYHESENGRCSGMVACRCLALSGE